MKYAIFGGERHEAAPGLRAQCPGCQGAVLAKCGERRIRHWAHQGTRNCDRWWESETEWHRAWKDQFPSEWQEVVHWADNGEKHIADVKTAHGRVIEFQHSHMHPEERRAREAFYGPMVWVVDGLRTKRGRLQLLRVLEQGVLLRGASLGYIVPAKGCALLEIWAGSSVPVYLDFGGIDGEQDSLFGIPVLWRIHPKSTIKRACVIPVPRAEFIRAFRAGEPCRGIARRIERMIVNVALPQLFPPHPLSFAHYRARKHRARSRIRF